MVRLQLDDQMDSKSLLGAYTCTAIPGEFAWQPGPLTQVNMMKFWQALAGYSQNVNPVRYWVYHVLTFHVIILWLPRS